jgi:hypothetical protein
MQLGTRSDMSSFFVASTNQMSQESDPSFMTLNQSNNDTSCCSATKRMFQHMYQGQSSLLSADNIAH